MRIDNLVPYLKRRVLAKSFIVAIPVMLLSAETIWAQSAPRSTEAALTEIVSRIATPLKKIHARKVAILDLRGPDGHLHPLGKWLADRFSAIMTSQFPHIETIDRSHLVSPNEATDTSTDPHVVFAGEIKQARSTGVDTFVTGDFARISDDQIGISLTIVALSELEKTHEVRTGIVPISKEIIDVSQGTIPGLDLTDGFPLAGKSGITMPICVHCPPPGYPHDAPNGGVVQLELVVTVEGKSDRIKVIASPSEELATSAVRAVKGWLFKPAVGFDGNPIAVVTPIEVTFNSR